MAFRSLFWLFLIKTNPFYMTFPAALPIMIFTEFWLIRKLYTQKKKNRFIPEQIYLHRDGETVEILFENKLWRKLKSEDLSNVFYIPKLKSPERNENVLPLKGDLFPDEFPLKQDKLVTGFAWMKYYRTPKTFLMIPKQCNYMDLELLTAVFNGKLIEVTKENTVELDHVKKDKLKKANNWMQLLEYAQNKRL